MTFVDFKPLMQAEHYFYFSEVLGLSGIAVPVDFACHKARSVAVASVDGASAARKAAARLAIYSEAPLSEDENRLLQKMLGAIQLSVADWQVFTQNDVDLITADFSYGLCFGRGPSLLGPTQWLEFNLLSDYLGVSSQAAELKKDAWQKLKKLKLKMDEQKGLG